MVKFINIDRTDEECLKNVIKYARLNHYKTDAEKQIKLIKKEPMEQIRYVDNQLRIYEARKNWERIIQDVIDCLI